MYPYDFSLASFLRLFSVSKWKKLYLFVTMFRNGKISMKTFLKHLLEQRQEHFEEQLTSYKFKNVDYVLKFTHADNITGDN